jgi:hypothetical protein
MLESRGFAVLGIRDINPIRALAIFSSIIAIYAVALPDSRLHQYGCVVQSM